MQVNKTIFSTLKIYQLLQTSLTTIQCAVISDGGAPNVTKTFLKQLVYCLCSKDYFVFYVVQSKVSYHSSNKNNLNPFRSAVLITGLVFSSRMIGVFRK